MVVAPGVGVVVIVDVDVLPGSLLGLVVIIVKL